MKHSCMYKLNAGIYKCKYMYEQMWMYICTNVDVCMYKCGCMYTYPVVAGQLPHQQYHLRELKMPVKSELIQRGVAGTSSKKLIKSS